MKKLLLSLFCLLAVAASTATAHAETVVETLTATSFKDSSGKAPSGTGYTTYYFTSEKTGIQYEGFFSVTSSNFLFNSSSTRTPYLAVVANKEGYKVGKINYTLDTDATLTTSKGQITIYGNNAAYTTSTIKSGTAMTDKVSISNQAVDLEYNYGFFSAVNTTNNALYFTKIEITYYKGDDPTVMKMDAKDLTIPFHETTSLENITFTPEISVGDLYTFTFSGDYGDALEFSGDCTNGYTVYGNTTGTYTVTAKFEGTSGTVAGKSGETTFDVTVGKDPSIPLIKYERVTSLEDLGEKANVIIASGANVMLPYASGKFASFVAITDSEIYNSTEKYFLEDESFTPFIVSVNPDNSGEYSINMGTDEKPSYLGCTDVTSGSADLNTGSASTYWKITCGTSNTTISRAVNSTTQTIRFNSDRFKTYGSSTGQIPQLYVDKSSVVEADPYTQKITGTTDIVKLPYHGVTTVTAPTFKVTPRDNYDSYTIEYICDTPGVAGFTTIDNPLLDTKDYSNSITVSKLSTPVYVKGLLSEGSSTITVIFTGIHGDKTYKAEGKFNISVDQDPLPAEGSIEAEAVTVEVGKSQQIIYDIDPNYPEEPGDQDFIKFTTESEHFSVDEKTGVVTGKSVGEGIVNIHVEMYCGPDKCHFYELDGIAHVYVKPETIHYTLVTDIAQLGQEAKVYIASAEARKILGAQEDRFRQAQTLDEADITDNNTLIFENENYVEFTVAKKPNTKVEEGKGLFSFLDNTSETPAYLTTTSKQQLYTVASPAYHELSIDADGNAKIFFGDEIGQLKYNSSSNSQRFCSYVAATSQYKPVQLYVRAKSMKPIDEYEMFMTATDLELAYHETKNLDNITYTPALSEYEKVEIEYVCSDTEAVEIDQTGEIHTIKGTKSEGATEVTVNFTGYRGETEYTCSAKFAVKVGEDPFPANATITVAGDPIIVEIGEEPANLGLKITPSDILTKNEYSITYTTDVDESEGEGIKIEDGKVTGLIEGEYTVTVAVNAVRGDEGEHHYTDKLTFTVKVLGEPVKYVLVTDRKQLGKEATIIIAANTVGKVISTNQKSNNRGAVTISGLTSASTAINHNEDFAIIKLTKLENGNYTLYDTQKEQYFESSNSANKLTLTDTPAEATITIASDGKATITFVGQRTIKYNGTNGSDLFSTYTSGYTDVQIYMIPQEIVLTPVTLSWSAMDPFTGEVNPVEGDEIVTTAEIAHKDGHYSMEDLLVYLNASVDGFPLEKLTVNGKGTGSNTGICQWVDDTFEYEKPGRYVLTVDKNENLADEFEITYPESLYITVNKINPEFGHFDEFPLSIAHQASAYTPAYEEVNGNRNEIIGDHQLNNYELDLDEGDRFFRDDLDPFMVPTLTPQFEVEWNKAEIDKDDPAHHRKYGHIYYEHPEDIIVVSNALDFEGVVNPGKYTLKIEVAKPYRDWFTETSSENLLIIRPNIEAFDITRMMKTDLGFQFAYHEEDFKDGESVPTDNNHEYFSECQFVRAHGGDIWYKISYNSSRIAGPAYLGSENSNITDKTDEELTADGYSKAEFDENTPAYSKPIDMRGATGIDLVEDVNGVRTETPGIMFDSTNIPTLVKEISSIEVADGETIYFTLQGIRVNADRLVPGIYVRRTATETGLILIH